MKKVILLAICLVALIACGSICSKHPSSDHILSAIPDSILRVDDTNLYIVRENNHWGVKNDTGLVIIPVINDEVVFMPPFLLAYKDGLAGLFTQSGQKIIEQQYSDISVCDSLICVVDDNGLKAAYNYHGRRLTDFAYHSFREYAKVFVAHNDDGKQVFTYHGKPMLSSLAKDIEIHEDFLYSDNLLDEPKYMETSVFYQTYTDKWGMISLEGRPSIAPTYDRLFPYGEYYLGCKFHKYQALDLNADIVTDFYDDIEPVVGGFIIQNDGYYGYLSKDNKLLLDIKYPLIMSLSNNMLWVQKDVMQIGVYSETGEEILPPIYEEIWEQDVDGSHIYVRYHGKVGVWDDNMFIIPIKYDDIYQFRHKHKVYWSVVKDNKHGLLRENSRTMFPLEYSSISYCVNQYNRQEIDFIVSIGDEFKRYSLDGKYIENVSKNTYFNIDAGPLVPWEEVKSASLLDNNAYIYEVCFSSKK
ncbi:MAG: hypothetical protein E7017_05525 [Alphaproteobacteria bacterium]|nr:hypothetical protein [Alphaproteobacteria bacterium]